MITDDDLTRQLRATLDAADAGLAAHPRPAPPWPDVESGLKHVRRARRVRRAGRVGFATVAVAAACAGVMSGIVPYPSYAPVVSLPVAGGHSALDDGRTRGTLAGDPAWLGAFRERVAGEGVQDESGGESWSPPAASRVSVLFASDVGEYRLALVEGDWHWGPIGAPQQVWYLGPAGAAAERMTRAQNNSPEDTSYAVFSPGAGEPGHSSTAVAVVSAESVQVELDGPPEIDREARVRPTLRTVPSFDGASAVAVTEPGPWKLLIDGRLAEPFDATVADRTPPVIADRRPLRGGALGKGRLYPEFAASTWRAARQPAGSGTFRVAATVAIGTDPGTAPAVVGVVTLPSGARVLAGGGVRDSTGDAMGWVDAAHLLPAGGDDDLAIAWHPAAKPSTAAMGPAGTATVQWLRGGTVVGESEARNTMAVTTRADITTARFLDASGDEVGRRAVNRGLEAGGPIVD